VQLQRWQGLVLISPIVAIAAFLMVAAGWQLQTWGLTWIWGVFILMLAAWQGLLVHWTRPLSESKELNLPPLDSQHQVDPKAVEATEAALQRVLQAAHQDAPLWEDWSTFWQRCQDLVGAIAHLYHPKVRYPLLDIHVPQVYGLIRGTVDDLDRWMQHLAPFLSQVTLGQAYQTYQKSRQWGPIASRLWQVWQGFQWILNPAAAAARQASERYSAKAREQLLANLDQLVREMVLRTLCDQAIALYSGTTPELTATIAPAKTQTLQAILATAQPVADLEKQPINLLLAGRTGAGKSSLINSLFLTDLAAVDVLPSTDQIQTYQWETQTPGGNNEDILLLWDTPGYEQVQQQGLRTVVLDCVTQADVLLLVTPTLDPTMQMDVDFLREVHSIAPDLPVITALTQVDRLRPIREWTPPYDWEMGDRPKEKSLRGAVHYRAQTLQGLCDMVQPVVTWDPQTGRMDWGVDELALLLVQAIDPAKQSRLARFFRNQEAQASAASEIIERYSFQMATTQGLTALLKSPVLKFLTTLTTGSPALANLLAAQIPLEQLPIVLGKLQMAWELFSLFNPSGRDIRFDLLDLWPLLLDNTADPTQNAWAWGHVLVEYWTQGLSTNTFKEQFTHYARQVKG